MRRVDERSCQRLKPRSYEISAPHMMVVARGGARLDALDALDALEAPMAIGVRGEALPFVLFLTAA